MHNVSLKTAFIWGFAVLRADCFNVHWRQRATKQPWNRNIINTVEERTTEATGALLALILLATLKHSRIVDVSSI